MNINEIVESKGYKNFMKYVYGWGASVVLIGALFKILHLPGSSIMLTIGLLVEALIFFFSGFEPLHEELDWTLVYPELAGLTDEFEEDETQVRRFDRAHEMPQVVGVPVGGSFAGGQPTEGGHVATVPSTGGGMGGGSVIIGGGSPSALSKFDELLMKADIGPEIFDKLGQGLNNFSNTVAKLADISDAGAAAKEFATKMQNASASVGKLDEVYQKSSEALKESVNTLSESYSNSAQTFNQSSVQLTEAYSTFANKLTQEINTVGNEGNKYSEKLGALNSNLSALNAVYELQIKNLNEQVESSSTYFKGLQGMVSNIQQTVDHTNKLNEGVKELEKNISSLNSIYGNMLSSVNFK
ncbi:MAG: gliding motility protein GldL [Salinivirgaceae bacterium]|nr:gliding motility protein GldL [Salinivirgaceae bacterium]